MTKQFLFQLSQSDYIGITSLHQPLSVLSTGTIISRRLFQMSLLRRPLKKITRARVYYLSSPAFNLVRASEREGRRRGPARILKRLLPRRPAFNAPPTFTIYMYTLSLPGLCCSRTAWLSHERRRAAAAVSFLLYA